MTLVSKTVEMIRLVSTEVRRVMSAGLREEDEDIMAAPEEAVMLAAAEEPEQVASLLESFCGSHESLSWATATAARAPRVQRDLVYCILVVLFEGIG